MPNWCESTYVFTGSKEIIDEFEKKIDEAMAIDWTEITTNYPKQDFGASWLGNLLFAYRVGSEWEHINCRGTIDFCARRNDTSYEVMVNSALEPPNDLWDYIIQKNYLGENGIPLIEYVFEAFDPDNLLFVNTDKTGEYLQSKYYLCFDTPECGYGENIYSEQDKNVMYLALSVIFETHVCEDNIQFLVDLYNEEHSVTPWFITYQEFSSTY